MSKSGKYGGSRRRPSPIKLVISDHGSTEQEYVAPPKKRDTWNMIE